MCVRMQPSLQAHSCRGLLVMCNKPLWPPVAARVCCARSRQAVCAPVTRRLLRCTQGRSHALLRAADLHGVRRVCAAVPVLPRRDPHPHHALHLAPRGAPPWFRVGYGTPSTPHPRNFCPPSPQGVSGCVALVGHCLVQSVRATVPEHPARMRLLGGVPACSPFY